MLDFSKISSTPYWTYEFNSDDEFLFSYKFGELSDDLKSRHPFLSGQVRDIYINKYDNLFICVHGHCYSEDDEHHSCNDYTVENDIYFNEFEKEFFKLAFKIVFGAAHPYLGDIEIPIDDDPSISKNSPSLKNFRK